MRLLDWLLGLLRGSGDPPVHFDGEPNLRAQLDKVWKQKIPKYPGDKV